MRAHGRVIAIAALLLACAVATAGPIALKDDDGRAVDLPHPARRAISLAPHATELAYAAGAGDRLVGVARGSDYPPQARALASVGDGLAPDAERVAALRPDLVLGWLPGGAAPLLPVLRALDVPVYYSDPRTLRDIPRAVERMGVLFGTQAVAAPAAAALQARIDALAARYAGRPPVRVFIQAGRDPVYTLNDSSIVSDALRVCGGLNVFANAPVTAPQVTREAVLAARPDVVVTGMADAASLAATEQAWRALGLPAALSGNVVGIDADVLYRPGPRLIEAAETLCAALDRARH
ncbi:cobalamin-binding protein [Bordetella genomosp. 9]|uniref:Cobalamin-binding protein n=1 Tax=Bordetella genomosp. 9 TaxID=1416803 RepID=A0A261R6Q9_9BORD|nr:cobalamin-binding protein [Bordetella genomosp. 9]OZI20694.1 cobalamin-binding protein [Bordetella genomosp. 9]